MCWREPRELVPAHHTMGLKEAKELTEMIAALWVMDKGNYTGHELNHYYSE